VAHSILYLDDEARQLEIFAEMFHPEYEVRTATTAVAARRLLNEHPAEIVISDQRLTETTGAAFLRAVAQAHPASSRILLTGVARVGDVFPELGAGVIHAFMTKPWTEQEMRQVLERAGIALATAHTPRRRPRGKGR
jgi:DNA-binding NtrC family response regulator